MTENKTVTEKPGDDEITEEEFDALLDAIDARKAPLDQASPMISEATAAAGGNDEITEEEFDAVLDRLDAERKASNGGGHEHDGVTSAVVDEYLTDLCDSSGDIDVLELSPNIGIAEAANLHSQLIELSNSTKALRIEAAQVEAIDTAVLQLFCVFIKELSKNDREVVWSDPSAALLRNASVLGLTTHLNLPEIDSKAA